MYLGLDGKADSSLETFVIHNFYWSSKVYILKT
jgi:hypothetical protein